MSFLEPIGQLFHNVFYEPIFNILMLIYGAMAHVLPGPAFGLSIIILTLLMRVCLIPLVRKQLRSQRVMQELQPKIAEIKRRYPGDQQAQLAAQQALFKEHGYSPVSGCLPLLIQMPFLYALYYAFFTVLNKTGPSETAVHHLARINNDIYPFLPAIQSIPQTHFLWLDLAHKDPTFILPLLAGLLTMVQLRMAMPVRKKTPGQQDATQQATQFTQYLMPVMTFIFGLNFPAGLPLYWSVSTGFSAVQQYFISGLGSLFVGLDRFFPSLKRFIPEPKEPVTPAPALAPRGGRAPAAAAAMPQPAPGEGGIRGMFKAIREQMSAAQSQATQQAQEREAARAGAQAEGGAGADSTGARPSTQPRAAPRPRRSRAVREAPLLVRPGQPAARPQAQPETEIEAEAAEHAPEGEPSGAAATAKTPPAPGTAKPTGGQQLNGAKTAANGAARGGSPRTRPGGKGSSTARGRSNRPKGSK